MPIKKHITDLLKFSRVYYPLQTRYRLFLTLIQKIKFRRQYAQYRGSGFNCNYCGSSFLKFAPRFPGEKDQPALEKNKVIAGYGENVYCPQCMSTSRERLVIAKLKGMNVTGKKILHLAPEEKIFNILKSKSTVTTGDIAPGFYSRVDQRVRYTNLMMLPFADESFDIVIANHIMEHIPDDRKAMKEIYRVLNQGGTAILQVPFSDINSFTIEDPYMNDPEKQSSLYGQKDHVRIYSLTDYVTRLSEAGFTVHYIPYESLVDFYRYAIQPGEGFISIKKEVTCNRMAKV